MTQTIKLELVCSVLVDGTFRRTHTATLDICVQADAAPPTDKTRKRHAYRGSNPNAVKF